ncbi:hypothetical protein CA267_014030 [Alteromonas pelagimontana]|uniref:Flagellar assembly protein T N-terminal domain-containing protein n=1 Tax=Alteromonas pelagimontana TaxID=1858656 RepID=A0A6M4MI64_9ALTE|nr:flagellar assembly protein T N-terminal domain-containing protein [Alteromonas pelagimontana]QJR81796.1 hypothetical protein CA267_014030 [Alteromonas pelagimontana]
MFQFFPPSRLKRKFIAVLFCLPGFWHGQVSAAWFEAQGQALITNNNKEMARHQATQEAIKQALLFAGASVKSVQTLTNGLLANDSLQVTAEGEVNNVELISENWHQDFVTVKIRADIFPQARSCPAATFTKNIATTYFPIQNREQAVDGQLEKLSQSVVRKLRDQFAALSDSVSINGIAPYTAQWFDRQVLEQAPALARQQKSQFVLAAVITDLSIHRPAPSSALAFWKSDTAERRFSININLIDGMNGATLLEKDYVLNAPWEYDRFAKVDVTSAAFWGTEYGQRLIALLTDVVENVKEILICQPATGRVIDVNNERIQVSIGREHGIKVGDELFLYQTKQVKDPHGLSFLQYNLYPTKVKVTAAYADSATVEALDNGILVNIQPNDFVAKR